MARSAAAELKDMTPGGGATVRVATGLQSPLLCCRPELFLWPRAKTHFIIFGLMGPLMMAKQRKEARETVEAVPSILSPAVECHLR